ncbi:RNA polymerase sigma factor [Thiospirochaeta perfilievii]|uniref:RNA polymerase sigma factor n=1 Tax=Thiospirochaeta perfilievii TaxID=252967 RepID=A0A5C1QBL5_9SPIO|nr:RNA polymerase sigma factor [Thiospirochaeta perfilievii]QEN03582.1 RNA polymerase sigma factor [Thiospirochaeta perfilievii]
MTDFSEVYDANFELIMRIAYRFTGDLEAAEDLCQDTFIKYFEKFGNKHSNKNEKSVFYLIKIVKNLSINYEKRRKIEYRVFNQYKNESLSYDNESGLSDLVKKEQISDIQKALLLIPYKYRLPLILKEYEQLSYIEISKIINSSVSNVKILIHRAKNIFKEKLKEIEHGHTA